MQARNDIFIFTLLEKLYKQTIKEYFSKYDFQESTISLYGLEDRIANEEIAKKIFQKRNQNTIYANYIFSNWGKLVFSDESGNVKVSTVRNISTKIHRNKDFRTDLETIAKQNHKLGETEIPARDSTFLNKDSFGMIKKIIFSRTNYKELASESKGDVNVIASYLCKQIEMIKDEEKNEFKEIKPIKVEPIKIVTKIKPKRKKRKKRKPKKKDPVVREPKIEQPKIKPVLIEENDYEKLINICSEYVSLRDIDLIKPLIEAYKNPSEFLEKEPEIVKKEINSIVKEIKEKFSDKNGKLYIKAGTIKKISFNPLKIDWKQRRFDDPMKYILEEHRINYEGLFGGALKKVDRGLYDILWRYDLLDKLKDHYKNIIAWKLKDNRGNILKIHKETRIGYNIIKQFGEEKGVVFSSERPSPDYTYSELLEIMNSHNPKKPDAGVAQRKVEKKIKKYVRRKYINKIWRLNGLKTHLHKLTEDKKLSIYFTYKKHYASIKFRTKNKAVKKTAIEEDVGQTTVYTEVKPFLIGDLIYSIKQHKENKVN